LLKVACWLDSVDPNPAKKGLKYWCQDETRIGLKTIERKKITARGVKPIGLVQWNFKAYYLYGAVAPQTGENFWLEFSHLDGQCFQIFLDNLGRVFKLVVSLKIGARNHLTLMNRGDLSNEQWETLKPLLPPLKPRTGKPNHDHRQVVNGILWILRTGSPWRDLPERYGKWQSVATRFYRWQKANIWQQVLKRLQADADRQGKLDWEVHYVDGTVIRAHQHAAGGKKGAKSRRN
jgi:transposase